MATAYFSIALSIEDSLFGKDIQFTNRRVELWKKEAAYDELIAEGYSNNDLYVFYNFEIEYDGVLQLPVVYFKIFDGKDAVSYKFPVVVGKTVTLAEGANNILVYVSLKDADTPVSNDVIECNAVVTDDTGNPYPNLTIEINIQNGETVIQELGSTQTNPLGFFSYSFVKDRVLSALMYDNAPELQFRYKYVGANGEILSHQTKLFSAITDFKNLLVLKINLPNQELFISESIDTLASVIGLDIPSNIQEYLTSHDIFTLRNIRSFGGLKRIPELQNPEYDQAVIARLDGHSQLETLSGDFLANDHVIDQGYDAVYKIAFASRSVFASKVVHDKTLSDFGAVKMHRIAAAHSRLFQTVYTNYRVSEKFEHFLPNPTFTNILNEINDKCNCDECEAAISPIAYLADLIWYAQDHLTMELAPPTPPVFGFHDGDPVTPEVLKEIFCNDFCLTEDYCNLIHEKICQYRIAIETLNCFRGYLTPNTCQTNNLNEAERKYLITAYFTLLEQLGTTYFEVRDVKNSNDTEKKRELADKLGIALNVASYDGQIISTDILYFDPYNTALSNADFNTKLETIFGLRKFTRGCTEAQPTPFIKTWKEDFLRLQWKKFDSNQDVYSLATSSNPKPILDPDYVTIDDFKDPDISAPSDALDIWLNRKNFIEEIWNGVFRNDAYLTPHGAEKEERYITVGGNHVAEFAYGKRFTLVDTTVSPDAEYTFTAEYAVYDNINIETHIHVLDKIENAGAIGAGWEIRFLDSVPIFSVSAHTITLQGSSTITVDDNSLVEIFAAGIYDGICHVDGAVSGSSTLTVDEDFSTGTTFSSPFPDLYFYSTIAVDSATVASSPTGIIRVKGDYASGISGNLYGHISNSVNNDGRYAIESVPSFSSDPDDFPQGYTTIEVSDQLPETADAGEFTYLSESFNVASIIPDMGIRRFVFTNPYAYEAIVAGSLLEIDIDGNTHTYTVDDVTGGGVDIVEALTDHEAGKNARIKVDNVSIDATGKFTIDGNYENLFNDPDITLLEITIVGGATYSVNTVTYDLGSNTSEFILSGFPSGDAGLHDIIVDYDFNITAIDVSGRKFTLPKPANAVLEDFKEFAKRIAVIDISDPNNTNNNEYTVVSVVEGSSEIELNVEEPIQNDTAIPSGGNIDIRYKEVTVPLFYQHPKVQAIFNYLKNTTLSYAPGIAVWGTATDVTIAKFIEYRDILLTSTDTAVINSTLSTIENDLNLTRDSFIRLANIAEKYHLEITEQQPERVTAEEYTELFNILISAVKKAYQSEWYEEEVDEDIILNYKNFWQSLTEPVTGDIDNSISLDRLLIDPQLIGLNKLPDMPAGIKAIDLWNKRNDYLVRLKDEIKKIRIAQSDLATGYTDAVSFGLLSAGPLGNITDTVDWKHFNNLLAQLSEINESAVEAAEKEINNSLYISVQDFRTIMQLHKRLEIPNGSSKPSNPPTLDEYEKLYQILVGSYKRRVLYPEWRKYESETYFHFYDTDIPSARTQQNYWLSSKAKLPKWRASAAERQEWLNALASRSIRPIIDPDLLFPDDFVNPADDAYAFYQSRKADITAIVNALPVSGTIETNISTALEINPASIYGFAYLLSADEAGEDIRPRLAQLHITYQGFSRLKTLAGVGYANMTPDEKAEYKNILTQAIKIREYYALWRDEESDLPLQANTITLSPDYFKVNKPAYNQNTIAFYEDLASWRTTWKERREWEQTLAARIEQVANAHASVENIIKETEKQVLPIIRDGLVMFCGQEYATLQENAKALERRLLVDFSINCCQETTRVSHAIDVMQKLLWSESIGIDKEIQINPTTTLEFELHADNFEEEWKWLGSYSTWRAAMFVFMYPENLLLPSLRRYQSPAFIKLVNEVQGNNRLTPLAACRAAKDYSDYYADIANLEPEATCNTKVKYHNDACLNKNAIDERDVFYAFAIGKKNNKAYWHSRYRSGYNTIDDYTFWTHIDGLGENLVKILGSAIYEPEQGSGIRHIYLFAVIHEDLTDKLVYIRYDLEKQSWDGEYTELSMPDNTDYSRIAVLQRLRENEPPKLLMQTQQYRALYVNFLNKKGKDWELDEWAQVTSNAYGEQIETIHAYLETYQTISTGNMYEELIFAKFKNDTDNAIWYRYMSENARMSSTTIWRKSGSMFDDYNDDGTWRKQVTSDPSSIMSGKFTGAIVPKAGSKDVTVFYSGGGSKKAVIRSEQKSSEFAIEHIWQLDSWLSRWINTSLTSFILNQEDTNFWLEGFKIIIRSHTNDNLDEYKNNLLDMFRIFEDYGRYLYKTNPLGNNIGQSIQAFGEGDPITGLNKLINIRNKYADRLKEIADWLYHDYALNSNESRAKDYKWGSQKLTNSITQYYNWDEQYDKDKAGKHLGGVLRNIVNKYVIKWKAQHETDPNGPWHGWEYDYNTYWVTKLHENERHWDAYGSPRLENSLSGAQVIVHNSGEIIDNSTGTPRFTGYRGVIKNSGTTGNFTFRFSPQDINGFKYASGGEVYRMSPIVSYPPCTEITEDMTSDELAVKSGVICTVMQANGTPTDPDINREYMREAWYFVPMLLGVQLSQSAQYEAALKWFKTVYDYKTGLAVYWALGLDSGDGNTANDWTRDMTNWLVDPLNPHSIAIGRKDNYLKYTISTIAQTFKAYADAQFTLDTVESVSKAKELYNESLELMGNDLFQQKPDECFIDWNETVESTFCAIGISDFPGYRPAITGVYNKLLDKVRNQGSLGPYLTATKDRLITNAGDPSFNIDDNLIAATEYVDTIPVTPTGVPLQDVLDGASAHFENLSDAAMSLAGVELAGIAMAEKIDASFTHGITQITGLSANALENKDLEITWLKDTKQQYPFDYENGNGSVLVKKRDLSFSRPTVEGAYTVSANMNPQAALDAIDSYPFPYIPNFIGGKDFCVAPNPTYGTLKLSIELNLFKIRNCMNIAGMKRELDPYAAPTDLYSGLPQIGANGQLLLPGTVNIRPTIYRYRFLLERAKQLANMAQQVESAFLAALEKYDSEKYSMLKAKQDLALAKATVKLKELQVKVSEDEVDLAVLQKDRSQIQVQELDNMINAGLNQYENTMIDLYWTSAALQATIAAGEFMSELANAQVQMGSNSIFMIASSTAAMGLLATGMALKTGGQIAQSFVQAGINVNSMYAAKARREQEWGFQKTLATQDIKIGEQQVKVAQDRVRVSEQDRKISELQVSNAEATIDFLNNKFTNADLYNWMSGVLEKAYSYFIQEAANAARLAQNQLAFERQELPQAIIQDDYWELPAAAASLSGGNGPDRRGLTGSTRLLVDITKLESYAIDSQKRKLQITKTFSLAAFFPMEFQQFKETGQITFDTLMDYFDRDYPGHYLRLINKVKVNIVALVPPVQGIKATLTSSGISHVVIGGSVYQDVIVRRDPETIALSGNRESNGMFELQPMDSELMNPFESSGVHTRWQLKMSKAANHFDFATIADVVLTIDYTALSSYDYEKQVQQSLADTFKSDRAFSFRNEFSDAFYQWTHPDEFNGNREVSVNISAFDFPANLSNIRIKELSFYVPADTSNPDDLVFSNPTGKKVKVNLAQKQTSTSGNGGFNNKGISSTRTNGGGLIPLTNKEPFGTWKISLEGLDEALADNKISDVIMVIGYTAETPKWI